jgi:hypothetical protein
VLYGTTTAAVARVTISSTRDVRTVVPDPIAHAFLVVYDGTVPDETFRVIGHLRDGTAFTTLQPSGS